jgi:hypothetical protein
MIELIMLACGVAGFYGALKNGRGGPRTPDSVDREERAFIKQQARRGCDPSTVRRYLDWKREAVGMPRRPGVNADVLAPRNDTSWTIKPGEEW